MPEMPEIQAHSERMTAELSGSTLIKFQLINFAGLKTFAVAPDATVGAKLIDVTRQAKYLVLNFDNGHSHVVHLMQGGRLRPDPKLSAKPRNGIARWVFEQDGIEVPQVWLLTEAGSERKAGVWVVDGSETHPTDQEPLSRLAPQADSLSVNELATVLSANSMRIHGLFRSQKIVSGLGRMLANEICHLAQVSPFANASKLSSQEIQNLHQAIQQAVNEGTKHERTLDAIGKSADRPSRVHNRASQPCIRTLDRQSKTSDGDPCGATIASVEYRSYTVFYCPTCQTNGKLLADNTTSKFLK